MQVELVAHTPFGSMSGIGRYGQELHRRLPSVVPTRIVMPMNLPFAHRFTFLHQLPIGLRDHQPGSLVHFMQIMGCSQMLWHPVRPAVATVHDLGVLVCPEDELLFSRFGRQLLNVQLAGLRRVDAFIADSEFTRRSLVDYLGIPEEQIHVVHLGVDRNQFSPVRNAWEFIAEHHGIHPEIGTFDLLYVGNEQPRKNLAVLLKALAMLCAQGHRIRLIKVGGSGGERWRQGFLQQIKSRNLEGNVVIVDSVRESDLALFYSATDLYVTASLLEGFGLPVLEAMACGTPVVCSSAGALPEVVGDAGCLIDPRDVESLASTIISVLHDPALRQRMSHTAMARAMEFTWEKTTEKLVQVYHTL